MPLKNHLLNFNFAFYPESLNSFFQLQFFHFRR
nr:MAG TPA: hypothetical protein [Caudoviricetes sp.]